MKMRNARAQGSCTCTSASLWQSDTGRYAPTLMLPARTCWVLEAGQLLPDGSDDLCLALGDRRERLQQVHRLGSNVRNAAAHKHGCSKANCQVDCVAWSSVYILLHAGGAVVGNVDAGVVGVVDDVVDADPRDTIASRTAGMKEQVGQTV